MQISDSVTRLSYLLDDCPLTKNKRDEAQQHLAHIVQKYQKLSDDIKEAQSEIQKIKDK